MLLHPRCESLPALINQKQNKPTINRFCFLLLVLMQDHKQAIHSQITVVMQPCCRSLSSKSTSASEQNEPETHHQLSLFVFKHKLVLMQVQRHCQITVQLLQPCCNHSAATKASALKVFSDAQIHPACTDHPACGHPAQRVQKRQSRCMDNQRAHQVCHHMSMSCSLCLHYS